MQFRNSLLIHTGKITLLILFVSSTIKIDLVHTGIEINYWRVFRTFHYILHPKLQIRIKQDEPTYLHRYSVVSPLSLSNTFNFSKYLRQHSCFIHRVQAQRLKINWRIRWAHHSVNSSFLRLRITINKNILGRSLTISGY